MKKSVPAIFVVFLVGCSFLNRSFSAEPAALDEPNSSANYRSETQDLLRSNLQLQEQLRNALRAIEQGRQDAEAAAKYHADLFTERLNSVEKNLTVQRERDLQSILSMRQSNQLVLVAAVLLAGIGMLALFLTVYFQIRALNRLAATAPFFPMSAPPDAARFLGGGALDAPARLNSTEQVTARFLYAIEQLEKKIHQLDSVAANSQTQKAFEPKSHRELKDLATQKFNPESSSEFNSLLVKGHSLLSSGDSEKALGYFESALEIDPENTEALIKKGTALEGLRKFAEAIETYDRALAADPSLTVAYLYKGGVLNRLQRFTEAMECYEQALRTHPKKAA